MPATFGQRLKAARIMAGLSMDALVEKMGRRLSKPAISKYENGLMMPDSENLILLADALNVAPDYFFSGSEIDLAEVNFRKKASLGKKAVESLKERVKDSMDRYIQLETLLGLGSPFTNPLSGLEVRDADDIEVAAAKLREHWGLCTEATIPHVVDLLEEHAVKVIELEGVDGFDGLSGKVDSRLFIVLNKDRPTDRKRLTALHEFAHYSMRFKEGLEHGLIEKLCHTFGGAFLMPAEILRKELGSRRSEISFYELLSLKERYGISMQAIMYRAKLHGIISDYAYERFSKKISAQGWRKNEPGAYPVSETPHRFEQLLHRALAEEVISIAKAAYLSRKSIPEIEKDLAFSDATSHP